MKKFFVFIVLIACNGQKAEHSLAPEQFNEKYKNTPNAVLLDVRTESEVSEGALPDAQNIVYDDSFGEKAEALSKNVPVFVYCASGKRSAKAAEILREKGFKEVYQLEGGLKAWRAAKMPL